MRTLIVTLTDSPVAQTALRRLHDSVQIESRTLTALPAEPARELALYDTVVFLDADSGIKEMHIDTLPGEITQPSRATSIVAQARERFRFTGQAFLCRIPTYKRIIAGRAAHAYKVASALEVLLRKVRSEAASPLPVILARA